MKKITLEINGAIAGDGADEISSALNDLSGIVAADVVLEENKAYAYCGDKLQPHSVSNAVRDAGYSCHVANEEYLSGVEDYKKNLGEQNVAPIGSIQKMPF